MKLRLGPIIGHATHATASVWIWVDARTELQDLAIQVEGTHTKWDTRRVDGEADKYIFTVAGGLEPSSKYRYFITHKNQPIPGASGWLHTCAVQPPEFTLLLASCNHQKAPSGKKPGSMWKRLSDRIADGTEPRPSALVLAGDQVYSDGGKHAVWNSNWATAFAQKSDDQLYSDWERLYERSWLPSDLRSVFATVPVYMMWDDHEIHNDWGSKLTFMSHEQAKRGFKAARRAYVAFQRSHGPPMREHLDYGIVQGRIGMYFLDLRSYRGLASNSPMTGLAQLQRLHDFMFNDASKVDIMFIVSSVPLAHISAFAIQIARKLNKIVNMDVADQWNYDSNIEDLRRLLHTLFSWQNQRLLRQCVVLSGDVHCGTLTTIMADHHKYSAAPAILQFTSSAVANVMSVNWLDIGGSVYKRLVNNGLLHDRTIDLISETEGLFWSQNKHFTAERNFGEVRVTRDPKGWDIDFKLHVENDVLPVGWPPAQIRKP